MRNMFYIDMHCHPGPKPYSWSLKKHKKGWDCRNVRRSLWYNDPPKFLDKFVNKHLGLTRFTQSDFRTLTKGDVRIVSACLSPIERSFVIPRCPSNCCEFSLLKLFGCLLLKALTIPITKAVGLFGLQFIKGVRRKYRDYFCELRNEYIFYKSEERKQYNGNYPTVFSLTNNEGDIKLDFKESKKDIVYVFFSIEGCHVFNNGGLKSSREDEIIVRENIQEVKNWENPPFYVSIAHHMYNELCGHAKSLSPPMEWIVDHEKGMNEGFSKMGRDVLEELLKKEPRRIYIDIKHMSAMSRSQYYNILDTDPKYTHECIPVFASHGAVNGCKLLINWAQDKKGENCNNCNNVRAVKSIIDIKDVYQNEDNLQFNTGDINFFDDEILRIARTGGFLGIQIDENLLCSRKQKKLNKWIRKRGRILYHQAGLVWKQIRYIAELLDDNGKFGWGTAAIGSDFDGLVDPPNGYWTSEDFGILEENLIRHATDYFKTHANCRLNEVINKKPIGILVKNMKKALKEAESLAPLHGPVDPHIHSQKRILKQYQELDKTKDKAVAQAQVVIDLFMRGNALLFIRNFYKDRVGTVLNHLNEPLCGHVPKKKGK